VYVLLSVLGCNRSHQVKMSYKLKAEYGAVLHMPVLKEGKDRAAGLHVPQMSTESGLQTIPQTPYPHCWLAGCYLSLAYPSSFG